LTLFEVGPVKINLTNLNEEQISPALAPQGIEIGGKWKPKNCEPRHHVAVLVPFRDRREHLNDFLLNMHPVFARQELAYGIYLIEPIEEIAFNRGLLFNAGFLESNKDFPSWRCHAYHDVRKRNVHLFVSDSKYFF
jgi:beta-1,4-galactosyltransferase 1/beta-1,4-galactosyltransferase 2